jgi:hypothetical protein
LAQKIAQIINFQLFPGGGVVFGANLQIYSKGQQGEPNTSQPRQAKAKLRPSQGQAKAKPRPSQGQAKAKPRPSQSQAKPSQG